MGDSNGSLEFFPTAMSLINEKGWTDIGNDSLRCQGRPGQATWHTNDRVKESRIDFIIANNRMTPAIVICHVDESSDYPTHRPLCIEVLTKLLEFNVKELRRPTNFPNMMEQRIEDEIDVEDKRRDEETLNGNETYQGQTEHDIRKRIREAFHIAIDDQLERRENSLKHAVNVKDIDMQWDLIAAAVEAAVIKVFNLENEDVEKGEREIHNNL